MSELMAQLVLILGFLDKVHNFIVTCLGLQEAVYSPRVKYCILSSVEALDLMHLSGALVSVSPEFLLWGLQYRALPSCGVADLKLG